ncbi:MAG: hypothetical protein LBI96_07945 [Odoribacteraceae bacterium]|jgi:hypothetical protein|nr:hypothetical protein [Odoribacteraceae bacterium]
MKYTAIPIIAALLFLAGCVKDTGNYTYDAVDETAPVITSTLAESYEAISLDQFVIDPQIAGNEDDYTYAWYVYPTNHTGIPYDTLGYERKLDYLVSIKSGIYALIFKVTSKENGTSVYQRSTLNVSSIFGKGFFVNKYANGHTDVDFVDRYGVVNPNILEQLNGEGLPGHPIRAGYTPNQYYYEVEDSEGNKVRLLAQSAYVVCSDEDMRIYNGDNLELLKAWDDAFLEVPAVKKPEGVWASTGGFMLKNNNALHFINNNGYTVGMFGYPYPSDDYKYAPQVSIGYGGYCLFDENAGTFLGYYPGKNTPLTEAYPFGVGHNYVDYDLTWMATRPFYSILSSNSYAIIKSRVDNSSLLVSIWASYIQSNMFVFNEEFVIPSTTGLADGKLFTSHGGGSVSTIVAGHEIIYYSNGDNKVHYYNIRNQTEKTDAITIPADEQIVYIEHAYDFAYNVNLFIVLSSKGGGWTVRAYDMVGTTYDIQPSPSATYSGDGVAVNLVYRHPDIAYSF